MTGDVGALLLMLAVGLFLGLSLVPIGLAHARSAPVFLAWCELFNELGAVLRPPSRR